MSEESPQNTDNKKKWRKKRKNFLSNAKKYLKKGAMGRGTQLPEEIFQYFVGILDAIKQGIQDQDERQSLVENVLARTEGQELNVVGNQLGSRVVELLLPYSSPKDLERFMEVLSPDLRRLCCDNFSSHIIETMLQITSDRATAHLQTNDEEKIVVEQNGDASDSEVPKKKQKLEGKETVKYKKKHIKRCHEFTVKICKYVLNNLEDFVWDKYANHIVRKALKCLSGITLLPGEKPKLNMFRDATQETKGIPPHETSLKYRTVPDEFKEIVKEYAVRLSSWPQFKDLPYNNVTSGLLQILLFAMKSVDKNNTKDLVKKLLNESFVPEDWVACDSEDKKKDKDDENNETDVRNENLPPVFKSEPSVRALEAALFVAKKKTYTQIYAKCFMNRLGQLALLPMLNFTVQRLVDNCQVKEEFESMFDEMSSMFGALLACGNTGVLVALAKACSRLRARQTQFVNNLEAALQCSSEEDQKWFSVCCLRLLPLPRVELDKLETEYFINIHGSIILQTIMDFQRPTKAVNSLLELSPDALLVVLNDKKGSHVADALCAGAFVGVKARDKFLWRIKGYCQKLALSQAGSRAIDAIFNAATLEQKIKMMTELSDKSNLLNSNRYGKLVASRLDVAGFKASQKHWEKSWKKKEKVVEK